MRYRANAGTVFWTQGAKGRKGVEMRRRRFTDSDRAVISQVRNILITGVPAQRRKLRQALREIRSQIGPKRK